MNYYIVFKPIPQHPTFLMETPELDNIEKIWLDATSKYPSGISKILSKAEIIKLYGINFRRIKQIKPYGSKVEVYDPILNKLVTYPIDEKVNIKKLETYVSLEPITRFFSTAKPDPVPKDITTQLGATFEEMKEMLEVFKQLSDDLDFQDECAKAYIALNSLATKLYNMPKLQELTKEQRVKLLDAMSDIIVTLAGDAYFLNMDLTEGLSEVNRSNFSKFENGKPLLNQHRKIMKGKDYSEPNLEDFV